MKNRTLNVIAILLAVLIFMTACNKQINITNELIKENWCGTNDGTTILMFYKTGTGRVEGPTYKGDFEWYELEEHKNVIRIEFTNGISASDYELIKTEEGFSLQHVGNGRDYIRVSDFNN